MPQAPNKINPPPPAISANSTMPHDTCGLPFVSGRWTVKGAGVGERPVVAWATEAAVASGVWTGDDTTGAWDVTVAVADVA
jgi:hypothetical protein